MRKKQQHNKIHVAKVKLVKELIEENFHLPKTRSILRSILRDINACEKERAYLRDFSRRLKSGIKKATPIQKEPLYHPDPTKLKRGRGLSSLIPSKKRSKS